MTEKINRESNLYIYEFPNTNRVANLNKRKHKKYRIKSHFRFVVFLVLILSIVAISGYALVTNNESTANVGPNYEQYVVNNGDTLWSIASETMPEDVDIRKSIYVLEEINQVDSKSLIPGMKINIPVE